MALWVQCKNGHNYVQGDIYENWPEGAPYCPECFKVWKEKSTDKYGKFEYRGYHIIVEATGEGYWKYNVLKSDKTWRLTDAHIFGMVGAIASAKEVIDDWRGCKECTCRECE